MTFQEFAATRLPALLAFTAVLTGQRATAEDIDREVLIRAHAKWTAKIRRLTPSPTSFEGPGNQTSAPWTHSCVMTSPEHRLPCSRVRR